MLSGRTLITIGVFSAYVLSVVRWARGEGHLYFDTTALLLVVVTLGGTLEAAARRKATESALRLLSELPDRVRVRRRDTWIEVARAQVVEGDRIDVRPGEVLPVDGRVLEGTGWVDESTFTGEARPRGVGIGERVLAGSQNLDGRLLLEAEEVEGHTVLATMESSLTDARKMRPAVQRLADRVAGVFVPGVLVLALGVFVVFTADGEPGEGLIRGLTVLLISCPCALGLAAPLATWVGLRRAAEAGVLVDSAETLESAALVRSVLFDKTGTLTEPHFDLSSVRVAPGVDREWAIRAASGLEQASLHPVARAFDEAARRQGVESFLFESVRESFGRGVEGDVGPDVARDSSNIGSTRLYLGSEAWAEERGIEREVGDLAGDSKGPGGILLTDDDRVLADFQLEERLRPDALSTVDYTA